eukprot:3372451-Amphidinium_carterae.2
MGSHVSRDCISGKRCRACKAWHLASENLSCTVSQERGAEPCKARAVRATGKEVKTVKAIQDLPQIDVGADDDTPTLVMNCLDYGKTQASPAFR